MAVTYWDFDIGPWVFTYWGAVRKIYELSTVKGMSNATVNGIAVGLLGELVAVEGGAWANSTPAANALLMACAAGLAANAFVGGS